MLSSVVYSLLATALLCKDVAASQLAAYWGQNSGGTQGRLKEYCDSNTADIIILSFLNNFPDDLNVNFSNQCGDYYPSGLLHCSAIGEDITYCQKKGKTVLLSLGGSIGNYGVTVDNADELATTLWNKFGAGIDSERPFDDAVIDGFDYDMEGGDQSAIVVLSNALRAKYSKDPSKKYFLSASPQCVYPDANVGEALAHAEIDYTFVQFYNNYCSLDRQFNWNTWTAYVDTISPNKNNKIFIGLPGSPTSAGSGYVDISIIKETVKSIGCDPNFGGISLWDASSAWANSIDGRSYADNIRDIVDSVSRSCGSPSTQNSHTFPSTAPIPVSTASKSPIPGPNTSEDPVPIPMPITSDSSTSLTSSATPYYVNSTTSLAPQISTETDIHTTVITITSCSDDRCTTLPVTTGVTTITKDETSYTTYCPLTASSSFVPEFEISTTVIPVTSCDSYECTFETVTTESSTVTKDESSFTTYESISTRSSTLTKVSSSKFPFSTSTFVSHSSSSTEGVSSDSTVRSSTSTKVTSSNVPSSKSTVISHTTSSTKELSSDSTVTSSSAGISHATSSKLDISSTSASETATSSKFTSEVSSFSSLVTIAKSSHTAGKSTEIHTTVITITSCSDERCTKVPVTTGLTTVTKDETSYTTYCPLSSGGSIVTETDVSTTVITITSCSADKCTKFPVTTGLTTVTKDETSYTTYCPLTSPETTETVESTKFITLTSTIVGQSSSAISTQSSSSSVILSSEVVQYSSNVMPSSNVIHSLPSIVVTSSSARDAPPASKMGVSSSSDISAPTTFPTFPTTVSTSTLYNTATIPVHHSSKNATSPQVTINSEGMAVSITSSLALIMLSILAAIF